ELGVVDVVEGSFTYECDWDECGLDPGADQVRATFAPVSADTWTDYPNWAGSDTVGALTVSMHETTTALQVNPRTAVAGETREYTATVNLVEPGTAQISGEIRFWAQSADGEPFGLGAADVDEHGQARLTRAWPTTGELEVWAEYDGNDWLPGSVSSRYTVTTVKAATEVSASGIPEPSVYGQAIVVHVDA